MFFTEFINKGLIDNERNTLSSILFRENRFIYIFAEFYEDRFHHLSVKVFVLIMFVYPLF